MRSGSPRPAGPVVVAGLGSPDRGDDGVGAAVLRRVADLPGVLATTTADPMSLLHLWEAAGAGVVVDAVRAGLPPGTVLTAELGALDGSSVERAAWLGTGLGGTHAVGLAEVVELARALDRLPGRLVMVGVQAQRFTHGEPLSDAVAAAVPTAAAVVRAVVDGRPLPAGTVTDGVRHPARGG